MTLLATAVIVLAMLLLGLVLFSALCRLVEHDPALRPAGSELLLTGLLPGLALVAMLVTALSLVHLVRSWTLLLMMVAILVVLRQDLRRVLTSGTGAIAAIARPIRCGNLVPLLAALVGVLVVYLGLFLCLMPAENVDIWVYHIPLSQSIAAHAGFVYPQIGHQLYASQPFVLEMLQGAAMVFLDHYAVASAVNLAIYMGMILLVLSQARRARGFLFLLLCYLFVAHLEFFSAATPMIDTPRACLSVGAFLFAWRYACNLRRLDLVLSALLAGFAVAAKTTELITPLVICATLAPLIWRHRRWRDLVPAAVVFTLVSSYWYFKNLILFGNPVYPFLFGHPGFSDEWMREYMLEMTRPFDVADRIYSNNLRTAQGWHDFLVVLRTKFSWLKGPALAALLGLALPQPRRWLLPFWAMLLFVIWYALMFNSVRWAITAVLLLTVTAFLAIAFAVAAVLDAWDGRGWAPLTRLVAPWRPRSSAWAPPLLSAAMVLGLVLTGIHAAQGRSSPALPYWMDKSLVDAMVRSGDPDAYLDATRPMYEIYHHIGQNGLGMVLQPYDNGAQMFVSAYAGGRPNRSILWYQDMPADMVAMPAFLAAKKVRYFVVPRPLTPVEIERLGPGHVRLADAMVAALKPRARLVVRDRFGNALYQIGARP